LKYFLLASSILLLSATTADAQNSVAPEIVQVENIFEEGGMRTVYVGNANNHYLLYCNTEASGGCIKPEENKNYLLFKSYRQILVTAGPVRRRRFWADGRSAWR
jgi:hypothetical protein